MRRQHAIQTQRGAAILLAMLILVLITSLAAGSTWRQSQVLEVEAAEREGLRYRLSLPDQPPLGPSPGPSHRHLCLRALALLPYEER